MLKIEMELRDIPNKEGFRFIGIRNDGTTVKCEVRRNLARRSNNCHYIHGEKFSNLRGWRAYA